MSEGNRSRMGRCSSHAMQLLPTNSASARWGMTAICSGQGQAGFWECRAGACTIGRHGARGFAGVRPWRMAPWRICARTTLQVRCPVKPRACSVRLDTQSTNTLFMSLLLGTKRPNNADTRKPDRTKPLSAPQHQTRLATIAQAQDKGPDKGPKTSFLAPPAPPPRAPPTSPTS